MTTSNPQTVGTVLGSPIVADLGGGLYPGITVFVTLSANYQMLSPPGYPTRPFATGAQAKFPGGLVPNGTRIAFLKPEADALVNAGAATYS